MANETGIDKWEWVLVYLHQHRTTIFSGQADENIDEWLAHHKRVCSYKRWDDTVALDNAMFFLS